jgi:MSHA type pilus biogenesis protein MshL
MKLKVIYLIVTGVLMCAAGPLFAADEDLPFASGDTSIAPVSAQPVIPKAQDRNKISLDIKGMDIVDVLKMLASRSGMNLVIGKNVSGKVTLFLKEVSVNDAFEIILAAGDLAYEKNKELINVMTQRDYELLYGERYQDKKKIKTVVLKYAKAADLSRALSQVKTNIGRIVVDEGSNTLILIDTPDKIEEMDKFIQAADLPVQTGIFGLNYAQAEKISAKIQELVTKGVGSVKIDERTNKIAVTDYPRKLQEIGRLIQEFDERSPQVLIDAQIIEINPSDKFEMGVDWDYWLEKNVRLSASLATSGAVNKLSIGTAAEGRAVSQKGDYKSIIDLLRTIGDTKILSSPRILVVNNQEAKILVGTKDAFITSTTSQSGTSPNVISQTVNFVDVGIKLFVTPTVNRDGFVTMKIKPEVSSSKRTDITSEGQVTQVPIVSTSEAETTIILKDGVTVIIGGLRKDERSRVEKRIPVLSQIPLLGALFKNTSDESKKTELVILLTPHIMSGAASYTDFSEIKPYDGAVARMVNGDIVTEKITGSPREGDLPQAGAGPEYYRLVTDKIRMLAFFDHPKAVKGEVKVTFVLSKDGNLIGEPAILETTNQVLNPFASRAVKSASPFPPFSKTLEKDKEEFKISLSYE